MCRFLMLFCMLSGVAAAGQMNSGSFSFLEKTIQQKLQHISADDQPEQWEALIKGFDEREQTYARHYIISMLAGSPLPGDEQKTWVESTSTQTRLYTPAMQSTRIKR